MGANGSHAMPNRLRAISLSGASMSGMSFPPMLEADSWVTQGRP
jgi:hypothetical protein